MSLNLSKDDTALMDRLFGPRIPDELSGVFPVAKAVTMKGGLRDYSPALSVLLSSIVHDGLGGGFCGGWRLYQAGEETVIAICRIALSETKAA